MKRFIIIVLDSVGVGAAPDAEQYHSAGACTLGHIADSGQLRLPNLQRLGLGNILPLVNVPAQEQPQAAWGRMRPRSAGKDTTCGHWEMAGLILEAPLPTYPQGFPREVLDPFCAAINSGVLGNVVASGTEIIKQLGPEHLASGQPIVYTSADSVFQIAGHEQVIPLPRLYEMCRIARELLQAPHNVGRVIARPFVGSGPADFRRTENRRDFSLAPPPGGLLAQVRQAGLPVVAVGKITDIFAGQDLSRSLDGHSNQESLASLRQALIETETGLVFANFVDFDMLYGHRNDVAGYARALNEFDCGLPSILELLRPEDILAICADHGNDPSSGGTDHDREEAPLLVCGPRLRPAALGTRLTFADLGQSAAEYLQTAPLPAGTSFLREIL